MRAGFARASLLARGRGVVLSLALFAACSPRSSSDGETTERGDTIREPSVPCDVREVLEANCQRCHASKPLYGAPMPLVTWTDMHAPSTTDPTKKVWQRIAERTHDAASPMPPTGQLPATDLAVLDSWLRAGAPEGQQQRCTGGAPPPEPSSSPLPCPATEQAKFVAHAAPGSDAPFDVPEDAGNLTMCFTFAAPWSAGTQATAFQPLIDDARVVHHWILFETSTPQPEDGVGRCKMPLDARFLQGWAPGNRGVDLPPDVGLHLPEKGKWLILQIHYWNAAGHKDSHDRSGVAMCTTSTPRPKTAIVSTLGSAAINLPPRSSGVDVTGTCTPEIDQPIHVIGAGPHMHRLGRTFVTEVLRGGSESNRSAVVTVPKWSFDDQETHRADVIINPGDKLRTTCRFDNPSDKRVTFGERTEDEMCFNFLVTYPAPGLVNAGGRDANRCID